VDTEFWVLELQEMRKPVHQVGYLFSPGVARKWLDDKGFLHRLDGPALEGDNGQKVWLTHGVERMAQGGTYSSRTLRRKRSNRKNRATVVESRQWFDGPLPT
jgi:hypothetical protein